MVRSPWRRCLSAVILLVITGTTGVAAQERSVEPVTDAMLQNPDPADWLNWRRTLDGWGYSPLAQIDRENVHRLQLVWGWQMNTGTNQPTPLVHDGVMYLANPGNVVQALDAVTGDRIWEYRRDLDDVVESVLAPRSRSIAVYGDKVYLNTADAHIVAPRPGHRRGGVGSRGRRQRPRLPLHERADRRQRQGRGRHDRLRALQGGRLLHLGPRRADRGGAVADLDHRAPRRPGRRLLGRPAAAVPRRGRFMDSRQLRSRDQPDLLVDLAGQAVGQREPAEPTGTRSTATASWRSTPTPASCRGTTSSPPARPTTSTTCSRAC